MSLTNIKIWNTTSHGLLFVEQNVAILESFLLSFLLYCKPFVFVKVMVCKMKKGIFCESHCRFWINWLWIQGKMMGCYINTSFQPVPPFL